MIKKYIKAIWFDLIETTRREEIPLLSIFTTQKVKFGREYNIKTTPHNMIVEKIESNVLKELENKAGGSQINYDLIFGNS